MTAEGDRSLVAEHQKSGAYSCSEFACTDYIVDLARRRGSDRRCHSRSPLRDQFSARLISGDIFIPCECYSALGGERTYLRDVERISDVCAQCFRSKKYIGCADSMSEHHSNFRGSRLCICERELCKIGGKRSFFILGGYVCSCGIYKSDYRNRKSVAQTDESCHFSSGGRSESAFIDGIGSSDDSASDSTDCRKCGRHRRSIATAYRYGHTVIRYGGYRGYCVSGKIYIAKHAVVIVGTFFCDDSGGCIIGEEGYETAYISCAVALVG